MTKNQNVAALAAIGTLSFSATILTLRLRDKRLDRLEDEKSKEMTKAYMDGWDAGYAEAKNDPHLQYQHYLDFKASMNQ